MSNYYHEFTPGFNWVYIVAPALLVLVAWLGFRFGTRIKMVRRLYRNVPEGKVQYNASVADKTGTLRMHVVSDSLDKVIGAISGIIVGRLLVSECFAGIVQYFDNGLSSNDSPIWSLFMAIMVIGMVSVVYSVIAACLFYTAKNYKCSKVKRTFGRRYRVIARKTRTVSEICAAVRNEWLIARYQRQEAQARENYYARTTATRAGR